METTVSFFELGLLLVSTVLLACLGYYLIFAGVRFIKLHKALQQQGIATVGRVISTRFERAGSDSVHIYPTFEYTTLNGHTHQVEAWIATDDFQIGQEVKLRYLPSEPEKIDWHDTNFRGYGCIAAGVLALGMVALVVRFLAINL